MEESVWSTQFEQTVTVALRLRFFQGFGFDTFGRGVLQSVLGRVAHPRVIGSTHEAGHIHSDKRDRVPLKVVISLTLFIRREDYTWYGGCLTVLWDQSYVILFYPILLSIFYLATWVFGLFSRVRYTCVIDQVNERYALLGRVAATREEYVFGPAQTVTAVVATAWARPLPLYLVANLRALAYAPVVTHLERVHFGWWRCFQRQVLLVVPYSEDVLHLDRDVPYVQPVCRCFLSYLHRYVV